MVKFSMVNFRNLIKLGSSLVDHIHFFFLFTQCKLAELMEMKNNSFFSNVNTRWISMFPTKRVLAENMSLVH